ncbi:MAG: hypothetical protein WCG53_04885, partial [Actinomycetes bacterium]
SSAKPLKDESVNQITGAKTTKVITINRAVGRILAVYGVSRPDAEVQLFFEFASKMRSSFILRSAFFLR